MGSGGLVVERLAGSYFDFETIFISKTGGHCLRVTKRRFFCVVGDAVQDGLGVDSLVVGEAGEAF
jgi:hypothetical protein